MKNMMIIARLCLLPLLVSACLPTPTEKVVDPCHADLPADKKVVSFGYDSSKWGGGPWYSVRDRRFDESIERYELYVRSGIATGSSRLECEMITLQER